MTCMAALTNYVNVTFSFFMTNCTLVYVGRIPGNDHDNNIE